MGWSERVPPVALEVTCGPERHQLTWQDGRVSAAAHPDLEAEAALMALGAAPIRCVELVASWQAALADGGFVGEWAEIELDAPVYRHHLRVAMARLRVEGVQDLLRGLPPPRAEAMGRFLLAFPQVWVDRAALSVIEAGRYRRAGDPLRGAIQRAVQVRARSVFVASLARHATVVRPAALVRFACTVGPWGCPPQAAGILDGTASWCRVTLGPHWLVEVWGADRRLDAGGDLVLDGVGTRLVWERRPDGRLAATRCREAPTAPSTEPADGLPAGGEEV